MEGQVNKDGQPSRCTEEREGIDREKTSIRYLIENRPHTNSKLIKRLVNANKEHCK